MRFFNFGQVDFKESVLDLLTTCLGNVYSELFFMFLIEWLINWLNDWIIDFLFFSHLLFRFVSASICLNTRFPRLKLNWKSSTKSSTHSSPSLITRTNILSESQKFKTKQKHQKIKMTLITVTLKKIIKKL